MRRQSRQPVYSTLENYQELRDAFVDRACKEFFLPMLQALAAILVEWVFDVRFA
jgi:hypothetical protein